LTRPGYTVLDIGANIGCHTLRFSKLVGEKGRVFAFEPTRYAYEKLGRNIELNPQFSNNITLEKKAVSNVTETNQAIHFSSSWLLFGNQKPIAEEVVDFVTVDHYVMQKDIERIDIMKIDVDGFEPEVVEGAVNTIKNHKPILFLEVNNTPKIDRVIKFLLGLNYLFVHEVDCTLLRSKEEIFGLLNSQPVNCSGFKTVNFILISDKSAYNCLTKC